MLCRPLHIVHSFASLAFVAGLLLVVSAPAAAGGKGEAAGDARSPAVASVSSRAGSPNVMAAVEILAVRKFHHDKRQPRPPRHRSERASSFASELDLAAAVIASITHDDAQRSLISELPAVNPLSGHPLELLRPPSLCA